MSPEHLAKMLAGRARKRAERKAAGVPEPREAKRKASKAVAEPAPAWAVRLLAGVDQLCSRVEAVELRQQSQQAVVREVAGKMAVPVKELPWHRCETCNERYQAPLPAFGSPRLCVECAKPGRVWRQCAKCDKVMPTERGTAAVDVICSACKLCPCCGAGGVDDFVCKRCQQGTRDSVTRQWLGDGVATCIGCNRQRAAGNVMCRHCLRDFNARAAGRFDVPVAPYTEQSMAAVVPDMNIAPGAAVTGQFQAGAGMAAANMG